MTIADSTLLTQEHSPPSSRVGWDLMVLLVVVYLFWFFTTPYQSNRLAFLGPLHFERILAITLLGLAFFQGRIGNLFEVISAVTFALFGFMIVSSLTSSYPEYANAVHWTDTYWKKIAFFLIVVASMRRIQHVDQVLKGMVLVIVFYQLVSWLDFLRGGSYVYQQGMKRMIGTWSGGGYGAANQYGLLCAFALPFIYHWYKTAASTNIRWIVLGMGMLSLLSVVFSGTRGALVVALAYLVFAFRVKLFKPKPLITIALVGLFALPLLPNRLKYRYWDMMVNLAASEQRMDLDQFDQIAIDSAKGRLAGMISGVQLGVQKPFTGYGPGTSPIANYELLGHGDPENLLQLHNLYGQVAAEIGIVGLVMWVLLLGIATFSLLRQRARFGPDTKGQSISSALIGGLFIMLAYGMFSHSFYDVKWLLLLGLAASLSQLGWDDYGYESCADYDEQYAYDEPDIDEE